MYKQDDVAVREHFDEQNHQYRFDEGTQRPGLRRNIPETKVFVLVSHLLRPAI